MGVLGCYHPCYSRGVDRMENLVRFQGMETAFWEGEQDLQGFRVLDEVRRDEGQDKYFLKWKITSVISPRLVS